MRIIITFLKKQAKNNFLHLITVVQVVITDKSVSESRKEKKNLIFKKNYGKYIII